MISSLVKLRSSLMAVTHSMGFCNMRSTLELAGAEYNCLANCCVMVLPPPALSWPSRPRFTMARPRAMKSMPECS